MSSGSCLVIADITVSRTNTQKSVSNQIMGNSTYVDWMYVGRIFLGEDVINQVSTASLWIYSLCVVIKVDFVFVDGS